MTILGVTLTVGHIAIFFAGHYIADSLRYSEDAKMQIPVLGPAPSLLGRAAPGLLSSLFKKAA